MLNDTMNAVIDDVCENLAEREELVHTIALALLTEKNLFVLGKPGQAKSQAIDLFRAHISGAKQFEILMSKGTDQEQLFGRLDLASIIPGHISHSALKNDDAEALGKSIDVALDAAVDQAEQTHTIMHAWGESSGEMRNTSVNKELLEYVKSSEELQKIARLLGKYREMMADKRKNSYAYGRGEKYDLTTGNDITNCLSSELALLGTAETEILFMRRYEQKRLMQYRKRDAVIKGKGNMIVLIDESSSTRSVAGWAKAFALALLDIAAKDKRKFAMVHFSSADQIKTDLFEPGEYTPQDVMKAAEQFFGGGTNFEVPLKEALWLMENGYENADITIITDGECSVTKEFTQEFREKVTAYKATVTGILLDKSSPCGQSLEPFCDKIYRSKDIAEDEIAVQILNSKVS